MNLFQDKEVERMTFFEKLAIEHPDKLGGTGGGYGCPMAYGYESDLPDSCGCKEFGCSDCWNREIPILENKGTCKYHEPFNGICCNGDCKPCVADSVDPETTCKVCKFFEEGVFECIE